MELNNREFLRKLVDVVWNFIHESEEVPSTILADKLIDKTLNDYQPTVSFELKIGKACGSCIHTNKPKVPRAHAAHYEVAKTERWCFKHSCHVTRETTCDDHEGVNRSAKTSFTRAKNYNRRQLKIKEVMELMNGKNVYVTDKMFFIQNNWLCYTYIKYGNIYDVNLLMPYSIYRINNKEATTDKYLEEIKNKLNNSK